MPDRDDELGDDVAAQFEDAADWMHGMLFSAFHVGRRTGRGRLRTKGELRKLHLERSPDADEEELARTVRWMREFQVRQHLKHRAMQPPGFEGRAGRITFSHNRKCDEEFGMFVRDLDTLYREEVAAGLSGRQGISVALALALDLLQRVPSRHDLGPLLQPLGVLREALSKLDRGEVHPLMAPRKRARGRPSNSRAEDLRIRAVLATKTLKETGMSWNEAERRVAHAAAPAAAAIWKDRAHYQLTPETVRNWRESYQARIRDFDFSNMEGAPPEAWAEDNFQLARSIGPLDGYVDVVLASLSLENLDLPMHVVTARVRANDAGPD